MPKKKRPQNTTGAVAGYVRVSDVKSKFPPDCLTLAQKEKFVENLRRLRVAELVADAGCQGETITALYDGMSSGIVPLVWCTSALAPKSGD